MKMGQGGADEGGEREGLLDLKASVLHSRNKESGISFAPRACHPVT